MRTHMKILVIGSGGREHALVWKLSQSPLVTKVYCAPGNAGTGLDAENVAIPAEDISRLLHFAKEKQIDLTVVGPEAPLVAGLCDEFRKAGLPFSVHRPPPPDSKAAKSSRRNCCDARMCRRQISSLWPAE